MTPAPFDRMAVLARCGATGPVVDELLAYTENRFDASRFEGLSFPLADEAHVEAWRGYAADATERGFTAAVGERLPQLRFPIEPGISRTPEYAAATRRGVVSPMAPFLRLARADEVRLRIHPTIAGALPVIVATDRDDFENLVRAFSCRNEPDDVPQSMGACIVNGYNNWDRVRRHKQEWQAANPDADDAAWKEEFARFSQRKDLYQDRFLILSSGPYSAVPAEATGFSAEEWKRLSVEIRLEHECTHYFTWRVLGSMRDNLLDEIIADYAGLVKTLGAYRRDLALLFFGLESYPAYRKGARLENYRGNPPLSEEAFVVLQSLVHAAISNIAEVESRTPVDRADAGAFARRIVAYASSSIEFLASSADTVASAVASAVVPAGDSSANPAATLDLVIHDDHGLERAIDEFRAFAAAHRLAPKSVSDICIVLDELLSNVIKYGFRKKPGAIDVALSLEGDELTATIVDDGISFNAVDAPRPKTDLKTSERPIGGLGIHIVRHLCDEIRYDGTNGKNRLFIRKKVALTPSS